MRFVISKRVDPAANPPIVRYWFTIVDETDEPIAAGDMLTDKGQVFAAIRKIVNINVATIVDSTGEKN